MSATAHPPIGQRTYVLGIIDSHGAVHSVLARHPGQIHEDFWPVAYRKWRYATWCKQLCVLGDKTESVEHRLTVEEVDAIERHLEKKGLR
jgi:hypothetical protein